MASIFWNKDNLLIFQYCRNYFMINLHESMWPGWDRTRDPWICSQTCICSQTPGSAVRHAFVARHVTDPSPVTYFRGDWSWNNFYSHFPTFRWIIQEGHLLGKAWPLGSRLWCLTVSLSLSHRYPWSGVVLDCIDSWSLHPYLLCCQLQEKVCARSTC